MNLCLYALLIILASCSTAPQSSDIQAYFDKYAPPELDSRVKFAKGFDIYSWNGISRIVVYHPETNGKVIGEYYLQENEQGLSFGDPAIILPADLDRVAVLSATQLNAFTKLGLLDKVVGISEATYIVNPEVRKRLASGKISELAAGSGFFVEKTIQVNPSLIFYSPLKVDEPHALSKAGIPMILYFDYMETEPLGRAEWIKFSAAFFGREQMADSIFENVANQYNAYKDLTHRISNRPTVFSDKYFNGQWFVPGGKSYIARLFKDAGAEYIWDHDDHVSSFPLDFETVFERAGNADYWRIIGSYGDAGTYAGLEAENELYTNFRAFREKTVIYCNARESGYFEFSPLEPHILLADLINVFHPELLSDHTPKYYRLLKEKPL